MNQHFNRDTLIPLVENTLGGECGKWQGGKCPSVGKGNDCFDHLPKILQ